MYRLRHVINSILICVDMNFLDVQVCIAMDHKVQFVLLWITRCSLYCYGSLGAVCIAMDHKVLCQIDYWEGGIAKIGSISWQAIW